MNVKKLLKDNSKEILPSQSVKDRVMADASRIDYGISSNGNTAVLTRSHGKLIALCCAALALLLTLTIVLIATKPKGGAVDLGGSIICIDVNPSVEIVLNQNDEIISVKGGNADGALLIYGEEFVGKTKEQAVKRIVELLWRGGYLDSNEIRLYIDAADKKVNQLYANIYLAMSDELTLRGVAQTINGVTEEAVKQAKKYGVSAAKYSLALQLSGGDKTQLEKLLKLSYEELYKKACDYDEDKISSIIDEIAANVEFVRIKAVLKTVETLEDYLDVIKEFIGKGDYILNKTLKKYNDLCLSSGYPEYVINEFLVGDELEEKVDQMEDLLDDWEDELEDELEKIKKNYLNNRYALSEI